MTATHFTLFFQTYELLERFAPILSQIPRFFLFTPLIGTPPLRLLNGDGWIDFPFPVRPGDVFIFTDDTIVRRVGGGASMRASVRVRDEDPDEVLILRLWHELLHAVGQPADDMTLLASGWQTPIERVLWTVWPYLRGSRDVPFWHRRYYAWLTERAAAEA